MSIAFSAGPDSTALLALAAEHGDHVTAHHVDHHLHELSARHAAAAREIASRLSVELVVHDVHVAPGPGLEARARAARFAALPDDVATGHTADDQAETVLYRLLRGAGSSGVAAMSPGFRHPILALRRHETAALCAELRIEPVVDPTNLDPGITRNRMRGELLPLANDVMRRDVVPILARHADLARDDADILDRLATDLDPTDADAIASAPRPLARRALRRWLTVDGYPPDAAAIERVLAVADGAHIACDIGGGRRVERSRRRFRIVGGNQ